MTEGGDYDAFLFSECVVTLIVMEIFGAETAGPVFRITFCFAGGGFCVVVGHGMRFFRICSICNGRFSGLIGVVLIAGRARPVFYSTSCQASSRNCAVVGHGMRFLGICSISDDCCSGLIGVVLVAGRARPVFYSTFFQTSSGFCTVMGHGVFFLMICNISNDGHSGCIREILFTGRARPVFYSAVFQTSSRICRVVYESMPQFVEGPGIGSSTAGAPGSFNTFCSAGCRSGCCPVGEIVTKLPDDG